LTKNQFSCKFEKIGSDNGKKFLLNNLYNSKYVFHETSCIATPQQNGIVMRKHQHLLNVCRALPFQAKISNILWSYSLKLVVHLINRLPTLLSKGYVLYDFHSKSIFVTRNVIFQENIFLYFTRFAI